MKDHWLFMYHAIASTYGWTFDQIDDMSVRRFWAVTKMIADNSPVDAVPSLPARTKSRTNLKTVSNSLSNFPSSMVTVKEKNEAKKIEKKIFSTKGNRIMSMVVKKTGRKLV